MSNKYTPSVVAGIKQSLQWGNTRQGAAKAAGINPSTFYEWLKDESRMTFGYDLVAEEGPDGKQVVRQVAAEIMSFRDLVILAEAQAANRFLAINARVAAGGALKRERTITQRNGSVVVEREYTTPDASAAQWALERRFPNDFGVKKKDDLSHLTDDELIAMVTENEELLALIAANDQTSQEQAASESKVGGGLAGYLTGPDEAAGGLDSAVHASA